MCLSIHSIDNTYQTSPGAHCPHFTVYPIRCMVVSQQYIQLLHAKHSQHDTIPIFPRRLKSYIRHHKYSIVLNYITIHHRDTASLYYTASLYSIATLTNINTILTLYLYYTYQHYTNSITTLYYTNINTTLYSLFILFLAIVYLK